MSDSPLKAKLALVNQVAGTFMGLGKNLELELCPEKNFVKNTHMQ